MNSRTLIRENRKTIDPILATLTAELEQEQTLVQETPKQRFQQVLKIYRGIKPLLTVVSTLPILPKSWRAAIVVFVTSLDALTEIAPELVADFKAGKDL